MHIRINSRVVVNDPATQRILLVRNQGESFWYAPGGGWDPGKEDIRTCAAREVEEETGQAAKILRLIYTQQFQATEDTIFLEWFWLAEPIGDTKVREGHQDKHGIVDEARWFTRQELQDIKVFPKRLRDSFWENLHTWTQQEDPFIGIS